MNAYIYCRHIVCDLVMNVDAPLVSNQYRRKIWERTSGSQAVRVEPLSHWESWIPAAVTRLVCCSTLKKLVSKDVHPKYMISYYYSILLLVIDDIIQ